MDEGQATTDPIAELITTYHELNSSVVEVISESISALEFMRYVARNRPFVFRGGASKWEATRTWNVSTLKELLKGQSVNVAVTPEGYVPDLFLHGGVESHLGSTADEIGTRILRPGIRTESCSSSSPGKNNSHLKNL